MKSLMCDHLKAIKNHLSGSIMSRLLIVLPDVVPNNRRVHTYDTVDIPGARLQLRIELTPV